MVKLDKYYRDNDKVIQASAAKFRSHPKFNVFLCDAILEAQIIPEDPNQSKKGQKYLFELLQQSHDGVISPHGVVFGSDTPEQRNHWVDSINDALAIQRKSEFQEGSEPEDDLDEEKINSRISAQQNSVIFRDVFKLLKARVLIG